MVLEQPESQSTGEGWKEKLERKIKISMASQSKNQADNPRKNQAKRSRMQAWRKKQEGKRLDGYVNSNASWRLQKLADTWGCSVAGVVERLVIEAGDKYSNVLSPEAK